MTEPGGDQDVQPGYGWSPEVQRKAVAACLRDKTLYGRYGAAVFDARWVRHAPLRPLAKVLYQACRDNGGEPPSPEMFEELCQQEIATKKPTVAEQVRRELALVLTADLSDRRLIEAKLVEYAQTEACAQAAMKVAELVDRGAVGNGHGSEIVKMFMDALAVGQHSEAAASLVRDSVEIAKEMLKSEPTVRTGFPPLDAMMGGGAGKGLHMIAGLPKVGKTAFLIQLSLAGCRDRCLAWHISGEVTMKPMFNRVFSSGTGKTKAEIKTDPVKVARSIQRAYGQTGGDVLVEYHPGFTVEWMGSRARQIESKGRRIGVVVVDMLDLMRSSGRRGEQTERRFELLDIGVRLRDFSIELGVPVWAAKGLSQRGGLAECFGLEYVVDNLFELEEVPPPAGTPPNETDRFVKLRYRLGREDADHRTVGYWRRDNHRQIWTHLPNYRTREEAEGDA